MTERTTVGLPLEIDRVERARADDGCVQLRLSGRWLDPAAAQEEELLVVQIEGRRHRFPGTRVQESGEAAVGAGPGSPWAASFTLPDWAEPRHNGQAALWLGSSVVPVPPPGGGSARVASPVAPERVRSPAEREPPPEPVRSPAESEPPPEPDRSPAESEPPPEPAGELSLGEPGPETPRSGPLADLLLKETVTALHSELEQRTSEAIRLRSALADAQSELEARAATGAELEAAQARLRTELGQLAAAVEKNQQDSEVRGAEADRERADLTRQVSELAAVRDQRTAEAAALREQLAAAQALAERRAAESVRLREELAAAHVARDAAVSEAAGLRSELDRIGTELAATRERVGAEGGDLGEAQRLLDDARALAEQLRHE